MAICSSCKQEMTTGVGCTMTIYADFPDEVARQRIPNVSGQPCGDCSCPDGTLHHPGCDMERCPKCRGQAISCDCLDTDGN